MDATKLPPTRHDVAPITILVAMPLIMAAFNREWLYTQIGMLDPWYMVGYFMYYHDSTFLADHYKLQRLPWILSGWLLYQVLGEILGNFVLHVAAFVVSTIFVYLTLARLVSRESAFVVAVLLTLYIPFHGAGGWDYQLAGATAYFAVTLYFLTKATQVNEPQRSLIASGGFFAAALYSTIHLINFVPLLATAYFFGRQPGTARAKVRDDLKWTLVGFSAVTVGLCLVNTLVGRGPFFFWPLLKIVFERLADPAGQKPWLIAWSEFFSPPVEFMYLIFLMATLAVCAIRLAGAMLGWHLSKVRLVLVAQYVFLALLWTFWQFLGHVALWPSIFANLLVLPAFLAMGGLLGGKSLPAMPVPAMVLLVGLAASLVPAIQGAYSEQVTLVLRRFSEEEGVFAVAVLALGALTASLFPRRPMISCFVAFLGAMFAGAFLQAKAAWSDTTPFGTRGELYWSRDGCISHERTYREIVRLFGILRSENRVLWQTWLWRGPRGARDLGMGCTINLDYLRGSVHSTGISNLGLATDEHPNDITDEYVSYVTNGGLVMAIVSDERDSEGMIERFARGGKKLSIVRRDAMNLGRVSVTVLIWRSTSNE